MRQRYLVFLGVFVALNVWDVVSTHILLSRAGMFELNPFVNMLLMNLGVYVTWAFKLFIVPISVGLLLWLIPRYEKKDSRTVPMIKWSLVGMMAMYGAVGANNTYWLLSTWT